ncbi:uncharacterized protein LOC114260563 [Camellia sinensis]|uniref:uncharacterized protein LOC114260563 n=1 Tax=Camellia sinensis TaxID=4442 RepID=UPI0010367BA4|nr:uncharacterized protein LOC114260563 [Camellia sinensis]
MTSAMRMLSYGVAADAIDDYMRIGESTAIQSLQQFCNSVIEIFGLEYLRSSTPTDIARLLAIGEVRGLHNDLNVLDRSPLFSDLTQGKAPPVHYTINGHSYDMGYYLADDIYPQWAILVQTISSPQRAKKQHFTMVQESARKDVERAFGVLQSRFAIIGGANQQGKPSESTKPTSAEQQGSIKTEEEDGNFTLLSYVKRKGIQFDIPTLASIIGVKVGDENIHFQSEAELVNIVDEMEIKICSPINQYTVTRAGGASNLMGSVNAPEDSEDEVPPDDAPKDPPANVMPSTEQPQY